MSLKAALWSRLLGFLDGAHLTAPGAYTELARLAHGIDAGPALARFLTDGRPDPAKVAVAWADIRPALSACRILFVPALFSGPLLRASPRVRIIDYLTFLARGLAREGFDVAIAPVQTAQPVAVNAAQLREILGACSRPIVLVTHSKGSVDALQALLDAPALQARIATWVALQAPFFGSPIADLVTEGDRAKRLSALFLKLYRGPIETLVDLRTDRRLAAMTQAADAIDALSARIPVFCLATQLAPADVRGIAALRRTATHRFMAAHGLPNDAMVPVASSILPGSRYAVLPGLAHGEPAVRVLGAARQMDKLALLKALITIAPEGHRAAAADHVDAVA